MSWLPLAPARTNKLWILFLNKPYLSDRDLCIENFFDFDIFLSFSVLILAYTLRVKKHFDNFVKILPLLDSVQNLLQNNRAYVRKLSWCQLRSFWYLCFCAIAFCSRSTLMLLHLGYVLLRCPYFSVPCPAFSTPCYMGLAFSSPVRFPSMHLCPEFFSPAFSVGMPFQYPLQKCLTIFGSLYIGYYSST